MLLSTKLQNLCTEHRLNWKDQQGNAFFQNTLNELLAEAIAMEKLCSEIDDFAQLTLDEFKRLENC